MDRTNAQYGRSDLQYSTQTPPWRAAQLPHRGISGRGEYYGSNNSLADVDIYALVDSWRSYKTDATNLQSQIGSTLNATAQPFEPPPKAQQYYTPYEPLRVSNGCKESNVVEANHVSKNKRKKNKRQAGIDPLISAAPPAQAARPVEPSAAFASRYPVRSNRGLLADQPIPSIEVPIPVNTPATRIVYKQSGYDRRSRTKSPQAPETTAAYRSEAQKEPVKLSEPRRLLVVLDLNGTLLYRSRPASSRQVHMRLGVTPLLDYLFNNHVVMVYTSAMPDSATHMVNQFLHPKYRNQLAAIWARDKLDLTKEQFTSKVQVYKKLDKVWKDEAIQKTAGTGNRWDQSNTVLVDDSKQKAVAQPHNLVQVTEYTAKDDPAKAQDKGKRDQHHRIQQYIMQQLEMKFEVLKHQEDVSRLIRKWQAGEIAVPRLLGQEIVVEETVDQKAVKEEGESTEATKQAQPRPHLLTPDSIGEVGTRDGDSIGRPQQISDDEDEESGAPLSPARSTISPIDEEVFRELLEGTGK
ncbi:hypothetical protein LTR70_009476 [Exophiala xenobiotica]|uniref:Mitochondrial import inner membrane translocase subunit TIM50 n=1 Tax=Lithohypha guttulata TaxID=1690604 RepID=A0ABR0JX88_9EURO|nr:hypothetical protein LTR24_009372 [Lithohypha guttulata]KAK5310452.1 hypothetical protein LTR70_009476 [Exophiala xenobiotica]